ncbi:MAG: hypothetical protein HY220_04185 [Candidatus Sungbacteria bacterium]|uniref:Uncharacterized protein n=1 Tax=Candidatus Sungiibacteriota bacterium TaxID=2750080 RepID=A0A9D6QUF6_9BACT|nr:hypothetical protein [Candidatus Sungbacteria bacterium]
MLGIAVPPIPANAGVSSDPEGLLALLLLMFVVVPSIIVIFGGAIMANVED